MKRLFLYSIAIMLLLAFLLSLVFKKKHKLTKGMKAPNFTLADETGALRSLSDFAGKKVVFYFYPHDETPGCTMQACSFRDNSALFAENGITVLGINFDSPESHAHFKEKYHLPFILLSDSKGTVTRAYGAESDIPGVNLLAPKRITFLINPDGTILKVIEGVELSTYAETVLKEFDND